MSDEAPAPTGRLLLVPCAVSNCDHGVPGGWAAGPAPFALLNEVKDASRGHIRATGCVVDQTERITSWTPRTADLLFGTQAQEDPTAREKRVGGDLDTPHCERWHLTRVQDMSLPGLGGINALELLAVRGLGVKATHGGDLGVLIVHLASAAERTHALIDSLYQHVRTPEGRGNVVKRLQELVGDHVHLAPLTGAREGTTTVYPVTAALDLHVEKATELLNLRSIATATPSKAHGSIDTDERLRRAKSDVLTLSDQWVAMVTGHGAAFASAGRERFVSAETYVSTLYGDALATSLLTAQILHGLSAMATSLIDRCHQGGQDHRATLQEVLTLRASLLWVRSTFLRIAQAESRITKTLMTGMEKSLEIAALDTALSSDVAALMEIVELEHRIQQNDASELTDARERRTNLMLTILALVSLPLTVAYTAIDLTGSEPHSKMLFWAVTSVTVLLAGLVIAVVHRRDVGRATPRPSKPQGQVRC